jgi:DNA-binding beta-propeller fold protein YncE
VGLRDGAVAGAAVAVDLPAGSDTPIGLVTRGSNAYVTIAHCDEVALVKRGLVVAITATGTPGGSGQHAPCWLALDGPYLYSSNSASHTLSRFVATGRQILLEQPVAAHTTGAPTDIAAREDRVAVIDADGASGRLTQFAADEDGNLTQLAVTGIPATANGIGFVDR